MTNAIKLAFSRLRRSPYQALVAISLLTMTLFLAGAFFILAAGSYAVLRYFETRPQVIGYFKREVEPSADAIAAIQAKLQATTFASAITYTSKAAALEIYQQDNQNYPLLLEGVTAAILPASLEVSATSPQYLKDLAAVMAAEPDIQSVQFPEDIVAPFITWTSSLRYLGLGLVLTHLLITFMTILLIISVKVTARRDEITVYQLLGATPGFISLPFVVEGLIYGLISGFLAWGLAYLVLLYSMPFWVTFLTADIHILPPPLGFMFAVLGGKLLLGSIIGSLGGLIAVQRFLKA